MLTLVIGVALFSTTAFADASFNSPGLMPTVTVTNATTQPCNRGPIDGCWKSSTTAKPGDIIAVQVYFKNTSNEVAKNVTIGVQPSRNGTYVSFGGGVMATNAPAARGSASATLSQVETITNMPQNGPYQANWYPSASSGPLPVNTDQLFGDGFPVGNMNPGSQGVLVVRFMVNGTVTPPGPTCSINNFSASPVTIALGHSSVLTWNTSNCDYVSVSTVGSNLATDGSTTVSPTNTTTYTLTAYPGGKTATATVTVTNTPPSNVCSVNSFNATPSTIQSGNSSVLKWVTTNCTSVSIAGIGSALPANGSQVVSPANTTTYTLTAYPGGQTVSTTVTVTNPQPNACSINSFTANPSSIVTGGSSNLIWNTTNCTYVNISSLGNNLAADGSQTVYPNNTTTYTLSAFPNGGTATVTVTVNNGNNSCIINSFNANPSSIQTGGSSNLSWDTTNCTYVNISGLGQLSNDGNQTVYPYATTTYTLTAYPGGQTSQATVTVNNNNNNYCSINSFYVDSNSISQGQTTTLHWSTSGSNGVYITGFGSEPANGSISISPYQSTTYTLTLNGSNCTGGGSQSVYVTVNQNNNNNPGYSQPQAITTVASVLSSYSAQLNGIAVPNTTYGGTSAWFEYGTNTSLGNRTDTQTVNSNGTYPYSANISGLAPGGTYYYRAAVQNQGGTAYGSVVPFSTPSAQTTYVPPTRVIVQTRTVTANNGTIVKSQASLFKLEVNSDYDHMCIGGTIDYTVNYQNISSQVLQNSILRITFPGELTYAAASQGSYDVTDRTLTLVLGDVQPGEMGSVTVHAQVNNQAVQGKLAVITATMVYTNPASHAQENAIAYSLITVSNDCPSVLGASVFGFGSFLPQTLLAWLLLILVILALIVLARSLSKKKEEPARTV